ncbi:MAG: enoyl-CoA hydratase [Myxococcota bacterium]
MSDSHILYAVQEGIATLTLRRPDKKNALTVEMYNQLVEGLAQASADDAVRVILWRAEGNVFTSGNDIKDFMNAPPAGVDSPVFRLLLALVDLEKPLVAAVRGPAIGIGTTALLHCDLVYCSDNARLQVPFVNLGLCPEGASSMLFPNLAGLQKASEWLLFGEAFTAEEALRFGLCNAVFPDASFDEAVQERVARLAAKPASSLRATKALLRGPMRESIRETMMKEGEVFIERLGSPEAIEAFTAFLEKRAPDFSRFR